MIELRLFTQPLLTVSVVTGFITFVCVSGVFFLVPFYLENVLGLDQQVTGLLLAVVAHRARGGLAGERLALRPFRGAAADHRRAGGRSPSASSGC